MTRPDIYNKEETIECMLEAGLNIKHIEAWTIKLRGLRSNAKRKGVTCKLTLLQYVKLAICAGLTRPSQIGMGLDKYCMARRGDIGDYVWGNCRFRTHAENFIERRENGGDEAGAEKHRGRTKANDAGVRAAAEKNSKSFVLVSPEGRKFCGTNLKEFAGKHGLNRGALSLVCTGKATHHKGWTGSYAL